jgi:hypothetical protein
MVALVCKGLLEVEVVIDMVGNHHILVARAGVDGEVASFVGVQIAQEVKHTRNTSLDCNTGVAGRRAGGRGTQRWDQWFGLG